MTKQIATGIATVSLLLNVVTPAFASTSLEISGNGSDSSNTTQVSVSQNTVVSQTNEAKISNDIDADANSGGNSASRNTGGDVSVDTGNAKTLVGVSNTANSNVAEVDNCDCALDAEVLISGNGAGSENEALLGLESNTVVAQSNEADIDNKVYADASTGDNSADRNTGGDVEVLTGNAFTLVDILNEANSNSARVGGGHGEGNGSVSLRILGNGADSDNDIVLGLANDVLLQQYNDADIDNDVDADAKTGDNSADRNTGGSVLVDTGDATAKVFADNAFNFNWADVGCDCLTDIWAKIAGNGDESENEIEAEIADELNVFQDNSCDRRPQGLGELEWLFDFGRGHDDECVDNELDAYAGTGYNDADRNTGDPEGDPSVATGDAETVVSSENTGNANVYGSAPDEEEHEFGGFDGVSLNITFDLHDLLSALGLVS
jgi:hypothetical protein